MHKKLIFSFIIFILLSLSGCANILNELPKTVTTYDNISSEENEDFMDKIINWVERNEIIAVSETNEQTGLNRIKINTDLGIVEVSPNPRRVITMFNEATEATVALGISPISIVESIETLDKSQWLDFMHAKGLDQNLPYIGNNEQLDIQAIRDLQPDLIIASFDTHGKYFNELNDIAPTIFSYNSISSYNENFTIFAEALGKKTEAEQYLVEYYDFAKEIDDKFHMYDSQYSSVLQIYDGKVYTIVENTFTVEVLKKAGFNFFSVLSTVNKKIETSVNAINSDIYFVSIGSENLAANTALVDDIIRLNPSALIYKVPVGVWDITNGYLSAVEMLKEINAILSDDFVGDNIYNLTLISE
ncbi:MAG: ABC transporter substrate-binding protein [Lachnospirales bacterium]